MISPLFKVHEPFMEVEKGFGFLGVVMYDDEIDRVQCHICGEWFKMAAQHARLAHGVNSEQYRELFSLPLHSGLMAKSSSRKYHARAVLKENLARCAAMRIVPMKNKKFVIKAQNRRRSRRCFVAKNRLASKNRVGLCPKQMMARYQVVVKIVGRLPSNLDLKTYDIKLYEAARRSGSVDDWRMANGLSIFPKIKQREFGDLNIIAALRKFTYDKKRQPSVETWRKSGRSPSVATVVRAFGGWKNALTHAGLM